MLSLGSGSSLDLDGVSAKGYDRCLFYASEDYSKVPYSGGRLTSWGFDKEGAPAIMDTGWIEHVEIKNGVFEGPAFLMQTGPWWETFRDHPNGPYPGLRSARFENVSWDGYGGIHIGVYKHGDIVFKGCNGRSQNTTEFLVPFYKKFGKTSNPERFLVSQTGMPIQTFLSAFSVGREEHFAAENGTVTVEDCSTPLFVNDRTPSEGKYKFDQEWHAVQCRSAKMLYVRDCDFLGFDLSYIHEPWAREAAKGSMGCECIYTKGDVLIERVKASLWGPGEGALIVNKPGGGKVLNCEVINDKNLMPEPYKSRLAEFSLVYGQNDPNDFIKTRPNDTAEPQLAMLALNTNEVLTGALSEIRGLIIRGCIEPPGGWENIVRRWGPHQAPTSNVKAYDLNGTLLWSN